MNEWDVVRHIAREKRQTLKQVSGRMGRSDNYLSSCMAQGKSPSVRSYLWALRAVDADARLVVMWRGNEFTIE